MNFNKFSNIINNGNLTQMVTVILVIAGTLNDLPENVEM